MRNKLSDLNNILFEQLERLQDDSLSDDDFQKEKERSKLVTNVAHAIIDNARLQYDAVKHMNTYGQCSIAAMPVTMLETGDK